MEYKEIISKSLQVSATTGIQIHPLDDFFVMEIHYDDITNLIVDDLNKAGYTIVSKQQ